MGGVTSPSGRGTHPLLRGTLRRRAVSALPPQQTRAVDTAVLLLLDTAGGHDWRSAITTPLLFSSSQLLPLTTHPHLTCSTVDTPVLLLLDTPDRV